MAPSVINAQFIWSPPQNPEVMFLLPEHQVTSESFVRGDDDIYLVFLLETPISSSRQFQLCIYIYHSEDGSNDAL